MKVRPPLGEQELEVFRFVADQGPITVGQVAERFGEPRGLARTTILTVMERLRKKGYLTRAQTSGVFHYSSPLSPPEVLRGIVQQFVERTLGGSLTPFMAYLAEERKLTEEEVSDLRRFVEELGQNEGGREDG